MTTSRYFGILKRVLDDGTYGFIDLASVTLDNGSSEHGLETSNDIFVHRDEITPPSALKEGMRMTFVVRDDSRRGVGSLRAFEVQQSTPGEMVLAGGGQVVPGFDSRFVWRAALSIPPTTTYGPLARMKRVAPEDVAQAEANHPFEGMPPAEEPTQLQTDEEIVAFLAHYLFGLFPNLKEVGISFSIKDFDAVAEAALIAALAADYRVEEMEGQAQFLEHEYARFVTMRRMVIWIWEKGLMRGSVSPAALTTLVLLVEETKAVDAKGALVDAIVQVIEFMAGNGLMSPHTVVPMAMLPDLYMAVPVWYFAKFPNDAEKGEERRVWESDVGYITAGLQYFGYLFGDNQNWADAFLMFNRRLRGQALYKGDMIPPHVLATIRKAREVFDYVVIMTPYHDQACKEWQSPEWQSGVDPYVVGFKKGLPVFFFLARFSDGGLFPLHEVLVADTMAFLAANKGNLAGFNTKEHGGVRHKGSNIAWLDCRPGASAQFATMPVETLKASHRYLIEREGGAPGCQVGTYLIERADEMLAAYKAGQLFNWLRGEWSVPKELTVE